MSEKPYEGVFWVVNGKLSYASRTYDPNDTREPLNHKEEWERFRDFIDGCDRDAPHDYYPRGNVVIKENGGLYKAYVYIDDCLFGENFFDELCKEFNLFTDICSVAYIGNFKTEHYTCHKCRKD